jgi:hypothetical protein
MKKLLALSLLALSFSTPAAAGQCYWVCNGGEWTPIKNGVCIMPIKPVGLCPIN